MAYATLTLAFPASDVTVLILSRPEAANALNTAMATEISSFFNSLSKECRAVILTGAGERVFCAGADLKERRGMDEAAWETQHRALRGARDALLASPVPVIAAVNGAALGGGLELTLACDFMYASASAYFALPEATLGIMPGLGGTQLLAPAIGERRAREIMLTGRAFCAEEAHAWGLVNRVCPPASLQEEALACAKAIAQTAPLSVQAIRRTMRTGKCLPLTEALQAERDEYIRLIPTRDRAEGIAAFNEKRVPVFTGA